MLSNSVQFKNNQNWQRFTGFEESMKPVPVQIIRNGLLKCGDTGYGMRATQIINPDSEDTIVRVSIALGNEFQRL